VTELRHFGDIGKRLTGEMKRLAPAAHYRARGVHRANQQRES